MKLSLASGNVYIRETLYQNKPKSRKYAKKAEKNISSMKKKPGILASSTNEKQSSSQSPHEVRHVQQRGPLPSTLGVLTTVYHNGTADSQDKENLKSFSLLPKKSGHNLQSD